MTINKLKLPTLFLLLALVGADLKAQNNLSSSRANMDLNNLYQELATAFKTKNIEMLKGLYTRDCLYITPEEKLGILKYRNATNELAQMFEKANEKESNFTLEYKLLEREVDGELAYDVGYFKLTTITKENTKDVYYAKFASVMKKIKGRWKIKVDSYNNSSEMVYNSSNSIEALSDDSLDE